MKNRNFKHFARPRRKQGESEVQSDLAYTPSQMMSMAEKGIAVSAQNVNPDNFFDGVSVEESTFNLPLDRLRGVDVADCWQAEQNTKKKAKNGLKNDIKVFGSWKPAEQKGE